MGAACGMSLPIIGMMLDHTQAVTTQRYAHLADDPVRHAAEGVSTRIGYAMAGKSADIVPLTVAG